MMSRRRQRLLARKAWNKMRRSRSTRWCSASSPTVCRQLSSLRLSLCLLLHSPLVVCGCTSSFVLLGSGSFLIIPAAAAASVVVAAYDDVTAAWLYCSRAACGGGELSWGLGWRNSFGSSSWTAVITTCLFMFCNCVPWVLSVFDSYDEEKCGCTHTHARTHTHIVLSPSLFLCCIIAYCNKAQHLKCIEAKRYDKNLQNYNARLQAWQVFCAM